MSTPIPEDDRGDTDRRRAALYIAPFLLLGIGNLLLILNWGVNPLWGFAILPPILFISVIGWIAFKGGFAHDRDDGPEDRLGE